MIEANEERSQPRRYISVEYPLEAIPEADKCPLCYSLAQSKMLLFSYRMPDFIIENDKLVPGYKCPQCENEWFIGEIAEKLVSQASSAA